MRAAGCAPVLYYTAFTTDNFSLQSSEFIVIKLHCSHTECYLLGAIE